MSVGVINYYAGRNIVTNRTKVGYDIKGESSVTGGTATKVKDIDHGINGEWAKWGNDDRLPTQLREKVQQGDITGAAMRKWIELIYGQGLFYYNPADGQDMSVKPIYDEEVEDFLFDNKIHEVLMPSQIADFGHYWCSFSEFTLNNNRDKITGLFHKTAEFCRLKPIDDTEEVSHLLYSPKFPYIVQSELKEIELLDPFNWRKQINQGNPKGNKKYAIYSFFKTPGMVFYPTPYHIGLFKKDGWIDYTNKTPLMLTKMRENQMRVVYHIEISLNYFRELYQGNGENEEAWDDMTEIQKRQKYQDKAQEIEDALTGSDNWGKSIKTLFETDMEGNELSFVKITAIDNKFKSDEWIPGNENASGTIAQAMGIDPTSVGMQKSGVASGSGSDKRVAFNTAISSNTIYQNIILWQLNFVARFNGWKVRFGFRHHYNVSTDFNKSGISSTDKNHDE